MKKPNNRTDDHRYDDIIDLPYPAICGSFQGSALTEFHGFRS